MPVSIMVTPSSASAIGNGHDVQADHRDGAGMTRRTIGALKTAPLRARPVHRGRWDRGDVHLLRVGIGIYLGGVGDEAGVGDS
jgi:hypothetical protein